MQYLTAEGISLFDETATTLQRDDELDPFAAAQTWSAALLQRCTSLKRLFAVNFHSLLLVTIFEGLKASKRTLRGVVWIDCGLGHPYFLSGLEIARAHITAAEGRAVFANLVWLSRGSRLPIQASTSESKSLLPLTSLALFDPTQEGKGNITTLFSFVRKETLRSVEINGQLGEEFVRGLSTDGYLLVFLSLTIHSPSPHGFLTAITHLLSYHPFLVSFMLSFRPSSPLPDYEGDGITLPRSLLEALPQPIHSFNLYMHVKLDEGTLNEFLGARRRTSLQTFVVEAKVDDEWEKQDLISSVGVFHFRPSNHLASNAHLFSSAFSCDERIGFGRVEGGASEGELRGFKGRSTGFHSFTFRPPNSKLLFRCPSAESSKAKAISLARPSRPSQSPHTRTSPTRTPTLSPKPQSNDENEPEKLQGKRGYLHILSPNIPLQPGRNPTPHPPSHPPHPSHPSPTSFRRSCRTSLLEEDGLEGGEL